MKSPAFLRIAAYLLLGAAGGERCIVDPLGGTYRFVPGVLVQG